MSRNRSGSLIRLGILALPAAGLLGLVGLISRYNVPNPRVDPEAAAWFASSSHYFASQFVGNVVGLTLLIPPTRSVIRRFLVRRLGRRVVVGGGRPDYDVEGSAREYDEPRRPGLER